MTDSLVGRVGRMLALLAAGAALAVPVGAWIDWADVPPASDERGAPVSDSGSGIRAGRDDAGLDPSTPKAQKAQKAGANADRRAKAETKRGRQDGVRVAATPEARGAVKRPGQRTGGARAESPE
ncbi:MAG: hypothetical protein M3354_08035 [Chloroflexota bacterium]|nr:hypothetical protein [Chloroflexota bacterium]